MYSEYNVNVPRLNKSHFLHIFHCFYFCWKKVRPSIVLASRRPALGDGEAFASFGCVGVACAADRFEDQAPSHARPPLRRHTTPSAPRSRRARRVQRRRPPTKGERERERRGGKRARERASGMWHNSRDLLPASWCRLTIGGHPKWRSL